MEILVAENVDKVYRSGDVAVPVLADLDLTVAAGEFVAVVGPPGSGKTTLLKCLSGLDDIDGGRVSVAGRDLFAMSDAERAEDRARWMGFVLRSANLVPVFTALQNVELPLLLAGASPKQARDAAAEMLAEVGLTHHQHHLPTQMSGGEQQRASIARALVARPAIVWADEPTGSLDAAAAEQTVGLLRRLNEQNRQTVVLLTQDPGVAAFAGRLLMMRDGRLHSGEHGIPPEVRAPRGGRPVATGGRAIRVPDATARYLRRW